MLSLSGLLTDAPRSLYPPPQGLARQANCQLVADDGRNWLLVDPIGLLRAAVGHRVAVSGMTDGHGLLVTGAALAPVAASAEPQLTAHGRLTVTGRLEPVIAAAGPAQAAPRGALQPRRDVQPRHRLTGAHGSVWLLAPHTDLDGLSGNIIQAEGWLIQPQQILAADVVRILPVGATA